MNRILYLLFFLICINISNAQSHLTFGSDGVMHPDTLSMGDPINFSFWIINQGNVSFTDSVDVFCQTFDVSGIQLSNVQMGSYIGTNSTIDPGDSLYISINGTVTSSSYVVGDNIVVIWPSSLIPGTTSDTSFTNIHIKSNMTSVLDKSFDHISIYPNPMLEFSYIDCPSTSISSLRIFDILGNIVEYKSDLQQNIIYRDGLKSGIYIIEIIVNSRVITKRVIVK